MRRKITWMLCILSCLFFAGCSKADLSPADQLKKQGEDSGYKNAFSELTEISNTKFEDASFLRLQQNYKGIPVYGRTAVYVEDSEGEFITVVGNVKDVDEDLSLEPVLSPEDAADVLEETFGVRPEINTDDLCIYNISENEKSHLVYCAETRGYEYIIDAVDGTIIEKSCIFNTQNLTAYPDWDDAHKFGVNCCMDNNGNYVLEDDTRNIHIYTLNGYESAVIDDNDNIIWKMDEIPIAPIISEDLIFGNTADELKKNYDTAHMLLYYTAEVFDYYEKTFSHPINGEIRLYYDDGFDNGTNGWAGFFDYDPLIAEISIGSVNGASHIDLIAHEYTHLISKSIVKLPSALKYVEAGALNEAISDIFGELIEGQILNAPVDWVNSSRNISMPSLTGNPSDYNEIDWTNTNDIKHEGHYNSTIISHAAYLMSKAGGGSLSNTELAKLWYRSIYMLTPDSTFQDCRTAVEWAAVTMSELDNHDRRSISKAFNDVGIDSTFISIQSDGTLTVLDQAEHVYDNYTIALWKMEDSDKDVLLASKVPLPLETDNLKQVDYIYMNTDSPLRLDYNPGLYYVELSDNLDTDKTYPFFLLIDPALDSNNIDIPTNFGHHLIQGIVTVDGDPMPDVTVTLSINGKDETVTTHSDGKYKFPVDKDTSHGTLTFHLDDYQEQTLEFRLTETDFLKAATDMEEVALQHLYASLIQDYEAAYGTASYSSDPYMGDMKWNDGVFYLETLDFDGDRNAELIIGYEDNSSSYRQYILDVWTLQEGSAVKVYSGEALHASDVSQWFELLHKKDKWYIVSGYNGYNTNLSYYEISDGKNQLAASYSCTDSGANYVNPWVYNVNGTEVSEAEYMSFRNSWLKGGTSKQIECLWGDYSSKEQDAVISHTHKVREMFGLPSVR